jgi:hypothetical protein
MIAVKVQPPQRLRKRQQELLPVSYDHSGQASRRNSH